MERRLHITSLAVFVCIGLALMVMFARVVQLQVAPSDALQDSRETRVTRIELPGVRGDILDRRGRPLAVTRFGRRVFVDPDRLPKDVGPVFAQLADTLRMPIEKVVERLLPALDKNDRIRSDPGAPKNDDGEPRGLVRYVSIGGVIDEATVNQVKALKIPGVYTELRSVRETTDDELVASIVGMVGVDHDGLLGAELFLDKEVKPSDGSITYVRDAKSRPLWLGPEGYVAPTRGGDVRLSIDLEIQQIAVDELQRGILDADAAGGRVVVMDPLTGEILAMADIIREVPGIIEYPWAAPGDKTPLRTGFRYRTIIPDERREMHAAAGRNRCVEDVYEPGSTFKPFIWGTITELGRAHTGEIFNTEGGKWNIYGRRMLYDTVEKDSQTWADVLVNSSNIGMAKGASRISFEEASAAVRRFGFGSKTNVGLPGETRGLVTELRKWSKYTQTSVAMGHEVAVTPIQMVRAFSAFARTGELAGTIPTVHFKAVSHDDTVGEAKRALRASTAELTRRTMRGVTQKVDDRAFMDASGKAIPPKYEWFGKSGTAEIPVGRPPKGMKRPAGSDGYFRGQYNSSFIAGAPVEDPRLVVVCVIDDPGPKKIAVRQHYGSWVAGPVVRRVMERVLPYLGVPGKGVSIDAADVASAGAANGANAAR